MSVQIPPPDHAHSPYLGKPENDWPSITEKLVVAHPLGGQVIVDSVLDAWHKILDTKIADVLQIGEDVKLSPQLMGSFLHDVIPYEISLRQPGKWRTGLGRAEKDIHCTEDEHLSVEVKTSSNKSKVFANRSYAQPSDPGTKKKDGYYLTVNFEKFDVGPKPQILRIGFGWLDHTDWVPQASPKGQQAFLLPITYSHKLVTLYKR